MKTFVRTFLLPLLVVIAAVFGAAALMATAPTVEPQAAEAIPISVRVAKVEQRAVALTVSSQGSVMPSTESELVPEVSGRIVEMSPHLVAGGSFDVGDVLLRIDDADYQTNRERARATLQRNRAELEHARFEYDRIRQLAQRKLASQSQLESAETQLRVAEAVQRETRAALTQAQADLERTTLRAPFRGRVRSERVDVGQFVSRGSAIATLYATDTLEVRLPIADRQLAFLNVPMGHATRLPTDQAPSVTFRANFAGRQFQWHGHVVRTEGEIDAKSRMVHVIARIDNTQTETPVTVGMFVQAEIQGNTEPNVVTLPRQALRDGNRVLVVDDDQRLRYREIDTLRLWGDEVLIRGGLRHGETVCISPLQTVIDGMHVAPFYDEPVSS